MMDEFRNRKQARRIFFSLPTIVILCIVTGALGLSTVRLFVRNRPITLLQRAKEIQLAEIEKRSRVLEERIARLETAEGKEAELRRQFQIKKPDESVLVIVKKEQPAPTPSQSTLFGRIIEAIRSLSFFSD